MAYQSVCTIIRPFWGKFLMYKVSGVMECLGLPRDQLTVLCIVTNLKIIKAFGPYNMFCMTSNGITLIRKDIHERLVTVSTFSLSKILRLHPLDVSTIVKNYLNHSEVKRKNTRDESFESALKVFVRQEQSANLVSQEQVVTYRDILDQLEELMQQYKDQKQQQQRSVEDPSRTTLEKSNTHLTAGTVGTHSLNELLPIIKECLQDVVRLSSQTKYICQRAIAIYIDRLSKNGVEESDRKLLDRFWSRVSDEDVSGDDALNTTSALAGEGSDKRLEVAFLLAVLHYVYNRTLPANAKSSDKIKHFIDKVKDVLLVMSDSGEIK